jgi:uncharacterized protein YbjT (DUF2867 family)
MTKGGDRPFLVIGATGRQGGATVRGLRRLGASVRALARDPNDRLAQELGRTGVALVKGDLDDVGSLVAAMAGVQGVFSVQNWWLVGATREVRQGKNVADAVKQAGIPHLVYSSVGGADRGAEITHWKTKWEIELYIRELGLPATILRPVSFMETYYIPGVEKGILGGRLLDPIRADKPYQLIAADDIGEWAALALTQSQRFVGKALEIAGDELTNLQIAATFERVMRRPVAFRRLPLFVTRVILGREFYQMFKWFNEQGYRADLPSLRRDHPEVKPTSLEAWLIREGWANKGKPYKPHAKTFIAKIPKDK